VAAVVREDKVVEEADDLTTDEMDKNQGRAIEIDDMLDMHNFLIDFDGDFSSFFGQEKLR
jgi:chromosome condensin MukBEF MukE localization factor